MVLAGKGLGTWNMTLLEPGDCPLSTEGSRRPAEADQANESFPPWGSYASTVNETAPPAVTTTGLSGLLRSALG